MFETMDSLASTRKDFAMRAKRAEAVFAALDKDGNGEVTREEIHLRLNNEADSYHHISGLLALFDQVDGDHDNKLTPLEWRVGSLEHTRTREDLEFMDFMDGILSDLEAIKNRKDLAMRGLRANEIFSLLDKDDDKFITVRVRLGPLACLLASTPLPLPLPLTNRAAIQSSPSPSIKFTTPAARRDSSAQRDRGLRVRDRALRGGRRRRWHPMPHAVQHRPIGYPSCNLHSVHSLIDAICVLQEAGWWAAPPATTSSLTTSG